jgi:UDP-N-acetylmuramoyl-L-alanyl-D-glutamate--2,6-diaminopimelate ligase
MIKQLIYGLKRPYHLIKTGLLNGLTAQILTNFPSRKLSVVAITGTDGKTTSSTLLYHILREAKFKCALLSTVGAFIGNEKIDTGFHVTTPQPSDLLQFMKRMVNQGYTHLVLEVTSHGAHQYRTWGVKPIAVGLTNIANEHLDYHLTYQQYVEAKALLLNQAKVAVLNADDQSYWRVKRLLKKGVATLTYSHSDRLPPMVSQAIRQRFPEPYNQMNSRLAYALAKTLGVANQEIAKAIESFPQIAGRMEFIKTKKKFQVVVDFAHTPQALEAVLKSLRSQMKKRGLNGKLIAVYGAAGLRDYHKRPVMGEIGTRLADRVIFTSEDPRTENPWSIIRQLKEQLSINHDRVISIVDRGEAIRYALTKLAKPGDLVAILGKGHEQSMCHGTTEFPWNDRQAVEEILNSKE